MSGDDYGQAFHDGETTGAAEERRAIIAWLRRDGWHPSWLGARLGIAHMLEGRWHLDDVANVAKLRTPQATAKGEK